LAQHVHDVFVKQQSTNSTFYNTLPTTNMLSQSMNLGSYLTTSTNLRHQQSSSNTTISTQKPSKTIGNVVPVSSGLSFVTVRGLLPVSIPVCILANDLNSGYTSDGPYSKYSTSSHSSHSAAKTKNTNGIRSFFGRLMRTSSGNIREMSEPSFKRGGLRSTAGARLEVTRNLSDMSLDKTDMSRRWVCVDRFVDDFG
jgi:hypothetical protein